MKVEQREEREQVEQREELYKFLETKLLPDSVGEALSKQYAQNGGKIRYGEVLFLVSKNIGLDPEIDWMTLNSWYRSFAKIYYERIKEFEDNLINK